MHLGRVSAEQLDSIMLRMARDAMVKIQENTSDEVFYKTAYDGTPDGDIATPADRAAQAACENIRQAEMPWAGVIAEEDGLVVEGELIDGVRSYFTFDGLDGTRRYNSGARDGIATMIAFVYGETTVAAVVLDVFNGTAYILQAATGRVVRRPLGGGALELGDMPRTKPLAAGPLLARGALAKYPPLVFKALMIAPEFTWYSHLSIGMSMASLWDDNVLMHIQSHGSHTPWDDTPVVAIGRALGMVWLRPAFNDQALTAYVPDPVTAVVPRTHMVIIVHRTRLEQLAAVVPVV